MGNDSVDPHGLSPQDDTAAVSILALTRQFLDDLHPGVPHTRPITLESTLERDLGLDSLSRVELAVRIERAFGIALPEQTLADMQTLRDVLNALPSAVEKLPDAVDAPLPTDWSEPAQAAPETAATLLDVLDWHLRAHPDRVQIVCLAESGNVNIRYRDLDQAVSAVAAGLQRAGLDPGQTVAIMLPTGPDYFSAYFGILRAGGVPVPIYPPARLTQIEEHVRRHAGILANAQASMLVTVPEARAVARLLEAHVGGLRRIATVPELIAGGGVPRPVAIRPFDTAFIQYTSGSTGDPKGVVLTHANLLANIRAIGQATDLAPNDVFVSWLPLYHDMGLIGLLCTPMTTGAGLVQCAPQDFLVRPLRWMSRISQHGGTITAGPNFSYALATRALRRADGLDVDLDLSSLRICLNGAEPVDPDGFRSFFEAGARFGLPPEAAFPAFGMAELCIGGCFPEPGRGLRTDVIDGRVLEHEHLAVPVEVGAPGARELAVLGRPVPGLEMRVVDPSTRAPRRASFSPPLQCWRFSCRQPLPMARAAACPLV